MTLVAARTERSAAIAAFELSEKIQGQDQTHMLNALINSSSWIACTVFALIGKACHYYADRQERIGSDGGPIPQNITVQFVEASVSPEEAYRRMVDSRLSDSHRP